MVFLTSLVKSDSVNLIILFILMSFLINTLILKKISYLNICAKVLPF
jgi:hypothetical protein